MAIVLKPVGIWIRVSTEDQAQGESPVHHEKRARLYAEAKGWDVVTVYDLSGVSGKSVMEHPEAKRMLRDLRAGEISGLIFSKLARLARNTKELLDFAEIFRQHNGDLISLQESIDTSSPAGRLFYTMIAAMAQWEREEIAERVAASVPVRAKLGKPIGGQPAFGYHWASGQLVPHPDEAPVRKLIYDLFLEHRRKKTVARLLNEQGYRTRGGGEFSDTTITRLLRDPTAKGVHRANWTRSAGRGKAAVAKSEEHWVLRDVPAIIAEETWARCNAILDEQRQSKPLAKKGEYLFSGLVACACGNPMYVLLPSPKYTCRKCRRKMIMDDLEAIFRDELKGFFFSDDELSAFFEQEDQSLAEKREQIGVLEGEQRKARHESEKLYQAYIQEALTAQEFAKLRRPVEERLDQIGNQIATLQAALDVAAVNRLSNADVISGARDLYSRWDALSFADKRSIVEAIVEQIIVADDAVEIRLHYVPSDPGGNGGQTAANRQGFIAATS